MSIVTQGYGDQGAISTQGYGAAVFEAVETVIVNLALSLKKAKIAFTNEKADIGFTLKKASIKFTKVE